MIFFLLIIILLFLVNKEFNKTNLNQNNNPEDLTIEEYFIYNEFFDDEL